jgi:tetratricopeptide (TPR) repeat protein
MSKKKRKSQRKSPRGESDSSPAHDLDALSSLDQRTMERAMRQMFHLVAGEEGDPQHSELLQAEDLVLQAYESDDPQQRFELATRALDICPACAEAFVCLGELAPDAETAATIYRKGMEAGEECLGGPKGLAEYQGSFWGCLETRPYMRARLGLAESLWALGEHEECLNHCEALLAMNPSDNQGVRWLLSSFYLELGRDEKLENLLEAYEQDASAQWAYSRALLAFRRHGDNAASRELLQAAEKVNSHTAAYLLGDQPLPARLPEYVSYGGESEAVSYAANNLSCWRATPGSLAWLRRTLKVELPCRAVPRRSTWAFLRGSVLDLPQAEDDVWQVDIRRLRISGVADAEGGESWILLVADAAQRRPVAMSLMDDEGKPTARALLIRLLETMRDPQDGQPRRPACVLVSKWGLAKNWSAKLAEIQVGCECREDLEVIEELVEDVARISAFSDVSSEELESRLGELDDLPQHAEEIWQADVRRMGAWIHEDGQPTRPSGALVASTQDMLILSHRLHLGEPSGELLREAILTAMLSPAVGDPHLPGTIEVAHEEFAAALRLEFEPLGVRCEVCPELDQLDSIFGELEQGFAGEEQMSALIDMPGVTLPHVAGFYDAAAAFYRQTPWRLVPGDKPVRIRCDKFHTHTWYVVVMGQSGMTLGLAMYEDPAVLRALLREEPGADRRNAGLSVMYGEAFDVAVRDLDAAQANGWPIASPDAHPMIIRLNPGMAMRPPLAWELELAEGCLRAIPSFLKRKSREPARMVVPAAGGELELELEWADLGK